MAFLHGVETIRLVVGETVITMVRSAVIGIVGTAPQGPTNVLTEVLSETAGKQFGPALPGFTLPKAIEARNATGAGGMLCVNVYDPALHNVEVVGEPHSVINGRFKLDYAPMTALAMVNQDAETLNVDEHYSVDEYGNVLLTPAALNGNPGTVEALATTSIVITGGTAIPGTNKVTSITIGGIEVLGADVDWITSHAQTMTNIAAQITSFASVPNWTAAVVMGAIIVSSPTGGDQTQFNDLDVVVTVGGNITFTGAADTAGGVTAVTALAATTATETTYDRFDPSLVTNSHLVGTINPSTNARSGFKLLYTTNNVVGYRPKLIICPNYAHITAISNEMGTLSAKVRAIYFVDAPTGILVSAAIQNRGPASVNNFNMADPRAVLCYKQVRAFDFATNQDENRPLSQYVAALIAFNDNELPASYAESPSNKILQGITGVEDNDPVEWDLSDPDCEANQLNAAGICTVVSGFGTGFRFWGNRNASYPTNTKADSFISVMRVADILDESKETASLAYLDKNITQAWIDAVVEDTNATMRQLEQLGRLMPGSSCVFDPNDNPPAQLAAGQAVFTDTYCPPLPAERITRKSVIDTKLLQSLVAA
jgi:phage tail sheath protein FI